MCWHCLPFLYCSLVEMGAGPLPGQFPHNTIDASKPGVDVINKFVSGVITLI